MKREFRYANIFTYGSLQSVGHTEEYFVRHTDTLVIYIIMPRLKNTSNLLRVYREGKLVEEKKVLSSSNIALYYGSWLFHFWKFILTYFSKKERVTVISGHPISFFGMHVMKLFRRVTYVFWVGDYYPPVSLSLRLYEMVKKYYHDRIPIRYYLSDIINKMMNGKVINNPACKTVMWGVKPITRIPKQKEVFKSFLFVGLVKDSQGLEALFDFLSKHTAYTLNIIGICDTALYVQYQRTIKARRLEKRVFFPNTFYPEVKLRNIARTCSVGVALYDTAITNVTYYTDPGKVKTYIELGLPVIMTNTSGIAPYITRFGCGEVISSVSEFEPSLVNIHAHYVKYRQGVKRFLHYFRFESYYKRAFVALEKKS